MLEKIEKEIKKGLQELPKSMLVGIFAILFMFIFILITDIIIPKENTNNIIENDFTSLIELFNKIDNNYTMKVNNNNKLYSEYTYTRDSNIELYELTNSLGYIKYNNSVYELNNDLLTKIDNIPFINDPYKDINIIKNIVNKCEFEYVTNTNTICNISVSDYINEYNVLYNKNYDSFSIDKIHIDIYYQNKINIIKVDYTDVNKIINNSNEKLEYTLELSNYNQNDYSEIIEYIKEKVK